MHASVVKTMSASGAERSAPRPAMRRAFGGRVALKLMALAVLASPMATKAQEYPTKPVRIVVAFAPGSATDTVGRVYGQKVSELLGQPVIIENKPGAVGIIGADSVAKSAPDGYTLLVGTNTTNAAVRALMKNVPYDPEKDFTPISFLGALPQVVIVNNDLPIKTLPDLINHARANPDKLSYAWTSSVTRVAAEMLGSMAKVKFFNVPYKTGSSAIADVISGQVNFTIVDMIVALPQIKGGKVRALAVTSPQRVTQLPEIPTVAEAGNLPGYEILGIFAAFGPANLPQPIVNRLNQAILKAGQDPELRNRFESMGLKVETSSPEQLRARFAAERVSWGKVATESGITPQ